MYRESGCQASKRLVCAGGPRRIVDISSSYLTVIRDSGDVSHHALLAGMPGNGSKEQVCADHPVLPPPIPRLQ